MKGSVVEREPGSWGSGSQTAYTPIRLRDGDFEGAIARFLRLLLVSDLAIPPYSLVVICRSYLTCSTRTDICLAALSRARGEYVFVDSEATGMP